MHVRWTGLGTALLLVMLLSPVRLSTASTAPASSTVWQIVGQVGGQTTAVAIREEIAYVGIGMRLVTLDLSHPSKPVQMGASPPLPHYVEDIAVQGEYAYVATGASGLRVIDISDPTNLIEVGAWDSPGYAEGLVVAGETVYLADGPCGVQIVTLSDPAQPVLISTVYEVSYAFDAAISAGYLYVAAAGAGLLIADVIDPAQPFPVATLDSPGYAYSVALVGETAVLADGWGGIDLIDVTDPTSPEQVAVFAMPGWAYDVAISGTTGYVANANQGLQIVDLSDPEQPTLTGGFGLPDGHAGSVAVWGDLAVIADRGHGLRVMSVADAAHPIQLAMYAPMGYAEAVAYANGYAYVAAGSYDLRVVDVSQPEQPVEVATLDLEGFANSVVVDGQHAYVCTFMTASYLYIFDITDPTQPQLVGQHPVHIACRDLAVQGTTVYIPDEWGLEIVDVSTPSAPVRQGYIYLCDYTNCGGVTGAEVSGDFAYIANQYLGLMIVDVSDPAHPVLVGNFVTSGSYAQDARVVGNLAYVADGAVLRVLDITDPTGPQELGAVNVVSAFDLVVDSETAYIASGNAGVTAVNVADPANLQVTSSYDTPGYTQGIDFDGQYAYAGDGTYGLLILSPGATVSGSTKTMSAPDATSPSGSSIRPYQAPSAELPRPAWTPHPAVDAEAIPLSGTTSLRVATTCTVVSSADTGTHTLRQCLETAVAGDIVTFDPVIFPPTSPVTIALDSGLPALSQGDVLIDASDAGVILDGSRTPAGTSGLVILSDGNVIRGLQIVGFPGDGIQVLEGAADNRVGGDRAQGRGPLGQGNRISHNTYSGVFIYGTGADGNQVVGNYLGVDVSGTELDENGWCVSIGGGAQDNVVGSSLEGERNLIGGREGINLYGAGTEGNRVQGNYIGTLLSGKRAFRSTLPEDSNPYGVLVNAGAQANVIGPGNVINGYAWGIGLVGPGTTQNHVAGNLVGVSAGGNIAIGNFYHGFDIGGEAEHNLIGGTRPDERNIISGNWHAGISLASDHNVVTGNYIGTNISGTLALGNGEDGIWLGAAYNQIGGLAAGQGNLISGNLAGGMNVIHQSAHDNWIAGNYVGIDATGSYGIANIRAGIALQISANRNTIQGNLVSGNQGSGILFSDWGTSYNTIIGNWVGTDASGLQAIPNQQNGISGGYGGSSYNRVGGTEPGQGNLVSGNGGCGISVGGSDTPGNLVLGNRVGIDASGVQALGNVMCGIALEGSSRVIVGGATPAERNIISGNSLYGSVGGVGIGGDYHVVLGNYIGVDVTGNPLPNQGDGVVVVQGDGAIIQSNVIAHNTRFGVYVESSAGITLRRNAIYDHLEDGIRLQDGNNQVASPDIEEVTPFGVLGAACAGCMVEVFSDAADEGRIYEGSAAVDASGVFTFAKGGPLAGPYVTATATDPEGNTSEFSAARVAWGGCFLPLVLRGP